MSNRGVWPAASRADLRTGAALASAAGDRPTERAWSDGAAGTEGGRLSGGMGMDAETAALWGRLDRFEVDGDGAFLDRLAREEGWTRRYAERVFAEYRRFLLVAAVADHVASPSEAVDRAWHLHLVYTRSYWDDLCTRILGRPLHHEPARPGEESRYADLRRRTHETYARLFGRAPPADVWPAAPTPPSLGRGHAAAPLLFAVSAPPLAALFGLPPPLLLLFYLLFVGAAFYAAIRIRRRLAASVSPAVDDDLQLSEIACLAGGKGRALQAVLAELLVAGSLSLKPGRSPRVEAGDPPDPDAGPFAADVHREAARGRGAGVYRLDRAARKAYRRLRAELMRRGYAGPFPLLRPLWLTSFLLAFGAAVAGMALRLSDGSRDFFTQALAWVAVAATTLSLPFLWHVRRTPAAERRLAELKAAHEPLADRAADGERLTPREAALAVALWGPGALAGGPHGALAGALPKLVAEQNAAGGCGGCGSGCGGD